MRHILLNDVEFNFIHERQQRKSIVFSLRDSKTILIKTPHSIPQNTVRRILQSHAAWICQKSQMLKQVLPKDSMLYLGKSFKVKLCPLVDAKCSTHWQDGALIIAATKSTNQLALQEWYKKQALTFLKHRADYWAQRMQVKFTHLAIRDQKSRWGSCSSKKRLSFNWRIIMTPPAIIDYLIIHECSHLREMNHSAAFWQIVAIYDPQFIAHRSWLKKEGIPIFHAFRKN